MSMSRDNGRKCTSMRFESAVISRLPSEWRGLFKQLASSVEKGNVWFIEETSSQYGSRPAWHRLFASLTKCDPTIQDDRLTFKPRFLLLPLKLQENLVKFLQQQSCLISDLDIKQFVLGVIEYTVVDSSVHQHLTELFRETKYSDDVLTDAIQKPSLHIVQSVQEKSENEMDVSIAGTKDHVIVLDESDGAEEPVLKKQRLEEDGNQSPKINQEGVVAIETEDRVFYETEIGHFEEKGTCPSFIGVEGTIHKIKEIWQNCILDSEIEGLSEVSRLSVKEIEQFCKLMDFDSMSDDSIELVCQHLCQIADSLSYNSAVSILSFVLGQRVMHLSQKASRKLSGALTLVSQKFPKQTVDSILLPCILQQNMATFQSEILCKTVKDSLNAVTKGYFIQKVMQDNLVFNENKLLVLQTLIDSTCDLTQDTLFSFTECLSEAAVPMAKNLKFGKLLLAVVNKHGKLFNIELKHKFEVIVDKHNTFLKKSILTALSKIKIV